MDVELQLQTLLLENLTPKGRRLVNEALSSFEPEDSDEVKNNKCQPVDKWWESMYKTRTRFAVVKAHMNVLQSFLIAKLREDYLGIAWRVNPRIDDLAGILQDEEMTGPSKGGDLIIRASLEELDVDINHTQARLRQIKQRGLSGNDLEWLRQSGDEERLNDFLSGDKHLLDDLWKSGSIEESDYTQLRPKIYSPSQEKKSSWWEWAGIE